MDLQSDPTVDATLDDSLLKSLVAEVESATDEQEQKPVSTVTPEPAAVAPAPMEPATPDAGMQGFSGNIQIPQAFQITQPKPQPVQAPQNTYFDPDALNALVSEVEGAKSMGLLKAKEFASKDVGLVRNIFSQIARGAVDNITGLPKFTGALSRAVGLTESTALESAGIKIEEFVNELAPISEEYKDSFWASSIPRGIGLVLGSMGAGMVTRPVSAALPAVNSLLESKAIAEGLAKGAAVTLNAAKAAQGAERVGESAALLGQATNLASKASKLAEFYKSTTTVLMGGVEGYDAFTRSIEQGDSPLEAAAKSMGYAALAGVIEADRTKDLLTRTAAMFGPKLTKEMVKKSGNATLAEALKRFAFDDVFKPMGKGALEEATQSISQDLIVTGGITDAFLEEGAAGAVIEGAISSALGVPNLRTRIQAARESAKNSNAPQVEKTLGEIEDGLTKESADSKSNLGIVSESLFKELEAAGQPVTPTPTPPPESKKETAAVSEAPEENLQDVKNRILSVASQMGMMDSDISFVESYDSATASDEDKKKFLNIRSAVEGAQTPATEAAPVKTVTETAAESGVIPEAPKGVSAEVTDTTKNPVVEVPVADLQLSSDVPQFKRSNIGGIVKPLEGEFSKIGTGPIQVWRRANGTLEVISGRHRWDLAKRSGVETIPAQIHDEAAGFTAKQAATLDAELNIRDEQGSVPDYAVYFRNSDLSETEASSRGLLSRSKGVQGWQIGKSSSEDVFAAHQAGKINDAAAAAIAAAAPNDSALQAVGLKAALEGKSADFAGNLVKAYAGKIAEKQAGGQATTGDLFGFDDTAIQDSVNEANMVSKIQKDIREDIKSVRDAARYPDKAKKFGVDVKDPKSVISAVKQLEAELEQWNGSWFMNPDLKQKLKAMIADGKVTREPVKIAPPAPAEGDLFAAPEAPKAATSTETVKEPVASPIIPTESSVPVTPAPARVEVRSSSFENLKKNTDTILGVYAAGVNHLLYSYNKQTGQLEYVENLGVDQTTAREKLEQRVSAIKASSDTSISSVGVVTENLTLKDVMGEELTRLGESNIGFGKYTNVPINQILARDPGWTKWLMSEPRTGRGQIVKNYISKLPEYVVAEQQVEQVSSGGIPVEQVLTPDNLALLSRHKLAAKATGQGRVLLTGKTYDWKDYIRENQLGVFNRNESGWEFTPEKFGVFVERLGATNVGQRDSVPANVDDTSIARLREAADAIPDESGFRTPVGDYIGTDTIALIKRGEKFGIPSIVTEEQVEDVARMNRAYQQKKSLFLLSNAPGTGKTFVLGAAIRELRKSGAKKIVYVTLRQELVSQIKNDLKDYDIGDVEFITYTALQNTAPNPMDVLIFDEAHAIKNSAGSQQGKGAQDFIKFSKYTIFSSATPFENPVQTKYLEPTGIFNFFGGFAQFAKAYGATVFKVSDGKTGLAWKRTKTSNSDQAAARAYLNKLGVFTARKTRLPDNQVDSRFVKINVSASDEAMFKAFTRAAADAARREPQGGFAKAWIINFSKRLMEAAKVNTAIDEAEKALARGRWPIIFVETKAERVIDIEDTIRREEDWKRETALAKAQFGDPPKRSDFGLPPQGITEVLEGFRLITGLNKIEIPSAEEVVSKRFGKDNIAVFTGSVSPTVAAKNLEKWRGDKPMVMVATMAKGGTGLSLHDKTGTHPTTQINLNLPWTATQVEQVSMRSARYGLVGTAEMQWLFADNISLDRELAARVGARMADMGAIVHGDAPKTAATIEEWDMNDEAFGEETEAAAAPVENTVGTGVVVAPRSELVEEALGKNAKIVETLNAVFDNAVTQELAKRPESATNPSYREQLRNELNKSTDVRALIENDAEAKKIVEAFLEKHQIPSTSKVSFEQVLKILNAETKYSKTKIKGKMRRAVDIAAVQLRARQLGAERLLQFGKTVAGIQALYDATTDQVFLATNNLDGTEQAIRKLYHELTERNLAFLQTTEKGRRELSRVLQASKTELMASVPAMLKETGFQSLEELNREYGFSSEEELLGELASRYAERLADKKTRPSWWRNLLSKLQLWLSKFVNVNLTPQALEHWLAGNIEKFAAASPGPSAVAYSKAKAPALTEADKNYLDAVSRGDTETAKQILTAAAKEAGYVWTGYHSTGKQFTEFSPDLSAVYGEFWFSREPNEGEMGEGKRQLEVFVNPKNQGTREQFVQRRIALTDPETGAPVPASEAAEISKQFRFDSVSFDKFSGAGAKSGKAFVVFDPAQVKSADLVTRDDQGNIIPPSQRFQSTSKDIRFAKSQSSIVDTFSPRTPEEQTAFDDASKKKVPVRNQQLAVAAVRLKNGEITASDYADLVEQVYPFQVKGADPIPTEEKIRQYIQSSKSPNVGSSIPNGKLVEFRIDIPTYVASSKEGDPVYAITAHEPANDNAKRVAEAISYIGIAKVIDPKMITRSISGKGEALTIATGSAKFPLATVKGNYEKITELPKDIDDSSVWTETSYNPLRSSYFVDVRSKDAVVSGSEAIMVGSRVFVKNPVFEKRPTGVVGGQGVKNIRFAKAQAAFATRLKAVEGESNFDAKVQKVPELIVNSNGELNTDNDIWDVLDAASALIQDTNERQAHVAQLVARLNLNRLNLSGNTDVTVRLVETIDGEAGTSFDPKTNVVSVAVDVNMNAEQLVTSLLQSTFHAALHNAATNKIYQTDPDTGEGSELPSANEALRLIEKARVLHAPTMGLEEFIEAAQDTDYRNSMFSTVAKGATTSNENAGRYFMDGLYTLLGADKNKTIAGEVAATFDTKTEVQRLSEARKEKAKYTRGTKKTTSLKAFLGTMPSVKAILDNAGYYAETAKENVAKAQQWLSHFGNDLEAATIAINSSANVAGTPLLTPRERFLVMSVIAQKYTALADHVRQNFPYEAEAFDRAAAEVSNAMQMGFSQAGQVLNMAGYIASQVSPATAVKDYTDPITKTQETALSGDPDVEEVITRVRDEVAATAADNVVAAAEKLLDTLADTSSGEKVQLDPELLAALKDLLDTRGEGAPTTPDGIAITPSEDGTKYEIPGGTTAVTTAETTTVTSPDGTVSVSSSDQTATVTAPDGTKVDTKEDGTATVSAQDGTSSDIAVDGTVTVTAADGTKAVTVPGETTTITTTSGTTAEVAVDGAVTVTTASGETTVVKPDGTVTRAEEGEPQVEPDGSVTDVSASGTVYKTTPEGTVVITTPEGVVTEIAKDGSITVTTAEGVTTKVTADKTTTVATTEGTTTVAPDKTTSVTTGDGTTTVTPDKAVTVTTTTSTTVVNPTGETTVTTPSGTSTIPPTGGTKAPTTTVPTKAPKGKTTLTEDQIIQRVSDFIVKLTMKRLKGKVTPKTKLELEAYLKKVVKQQLADQITIDKTKVDRPITAAELLVENLDLAQQAFEKSKTDLLAKVTLSPEQKAEVQKATFKDYDYKKVRKVLRTRLDVRDLVRKSLADRQASLGDLLQELTDGTSLTKEQVDRVANALKEVFDAEAKLEAKKQLEALSNKRTTQAKVKLDNFDKLLKYFNLGGFDTADFYNAVAQSNPQLKLPTYDPLFVAQIKKDATDIQAMPASDVKQEKAMKLMTRIAQKHNQSLRGMARAKFFLGDVAPALWKAGILSGISTQGVNAIGSFANVGINGVFQALGYQSKTIRQFGVKASLGFYKDVFSALANLTGMAKNSNPYNVLLRQAAEMGKTRFNTSQAEQLGVLEQFKYLPHKLVGRAMAMADGINTQLGYEINQRHAFRYAMLMDPTTSKSDLEIAFDPDMKTLEAIEVQLNKEKLSGRDRDLRRIGLIEQYRQDLVKNENYLTESLEPALQWTFNGQPTGLVGSLFEGFAATARKLSFGISDYFMPFMRTVASMANAAVDFSPFGLLRAYNKRISLLTMEEGNKYRPKVIEEGSPEQIALIAKAVTGTAILIGFGLAVMRGLKDEEEGREPFFSVYGSGPSNFLKRDEWKKAGFVPRTIRFGNKYIPYNDLPNVSLILGALGTIADTYRFVKRKDEREPFELPKLALLGVVNTFFEKNLLSGVANLLEIIQNVDQRGIIGFDRLVTSTLAGFSNPALVKFAGDQLFRTDENGKLIVTDVAASEAFLASITPFGGTFKQPALDVFGEPMTQGRLEPITRRFFSMRNEEHPIFTPLLRQQLIVPTPSRSTQFRFQGERHTFSINNDLYRRFVEVRGKHMAKVLTPEMANRIAEIAKTTNRTVAQDILGRIATRAREVAVATVEAELRAGKLKLRK